MIQNLLACGRVLGYLYGLIGFFFMAALDAVVSIANSVIEHVFTTKDTSLGEVLAISIVANAVCFGFTSVLYVYAAIALAKALCGTVRRVHHDLAEHRLKMQAETASA